MEIHVHLCIQMKKSIDICIFMYCSLFIHIYIPCVRLEAITQTQRVTWMWKSYGLHPALNPLFPVPKHEDTRTLWHEKRQQNYTEKLRWVYLRVHPGFILAKGDGVYMPPCQCVSVSLRHLHMPLLPCSVHSGFILAKGGVLPCECACVQKM